MEVAHLGIKVTIVEPGAVRTAFGAGAVTQPVGISDYADSVGKALEWFEGLVGKQPNDPRRVAAAILRAVDSPDPPLHLALGPEAVKAVRDKLDAHRRELDAWAEEVAPEQRSPPLTHPGDVVDSRWESFGPFQTLLDR